jgi:hypothetical protein
MALPLTYTCLKSALALFLGYKSYKFNSIYILFTWVDVYLCPYPISFETALFVLLLLNGYDVSQEK